MISCVKIWNANRKFFWFLVFRDTMAEVLLFAGIIEPQYVEILGKQGRAIFDPAVLKDNGVFVGRPAAG